VPGRCKVYAARVLLGKGATRHVRAVRPPTAPLRRPAVPDRQPGTVGGLA